MKSNKLPADRAVGTPTTTSKRQWQATAVALAAAALLSLPSTPANALALGRVTVQSALGEPMRAEVDVPQITPDEVATLRVNIGSPEAFRAAGLEYSPALAGVSVNLQRRPDGRYFLRLAGDRPIHEPFVDLILETNWASGRIVRDLTMLFDPPAMRQNQQTMTAQVAPSPGSGSATAPATPQRSRTSPPAAAAVTPAPAAPAAAPAPAAAAPAPAPTAAAPATPDAAAPAPAAVAPATPDTAAATPTPTTPSAAAPTPLEPAPAPSGESKQVTVQAGDTAGRIAAANKPNAVSLDQMLLALLRANPEAFVDGNVNRLRSGSVLNLPTAEQAQAVPAAEATQTLVAQSRDFNEFRRRLAESVAAAPAAGTQREASGRVQAQVEEKRPAAASPDKLTLSKGGAQGRAGEERIAQSRASQEASTRVAELNRNLEELNKLQQSVPAGAASAPRAGASAPGTGASTGPSAAAAARPASSPALPSVAVPLPSGSTSTAPAAAAAKPASAPVVASAPVAAAATATPASAPAASTAAVPASGPAAAAAPSTPEPSPAATSAATPASAPAAVAAQRPVTPAPAVQEPGLVDDLLSNPLVPAGLGGALALLLGLGAWKARKRQKSAQVDSSFLESRLQPDSFFGASGGQRVDTAEGTPTGSSMVYSPSQLDAAGDVDPVAEADVYLAYGRDLQAEEILKEALRMNPQRIAIHTKLLEIYAKRRDAKAFEQLAGEAYSLSHGQGSEWAHICELGMELDSSNPMFQPGGPSGSAPLAASAVAAAAAVTDATPRKPAAKEPPHDPGPSSSVDLDLDFSLDDEPLAAAPVPASKAKPSAEPAMPPMPSLDMDFAGATKGSPAAPGASRPEAAAPAASDNSLNFIATEPVALSSPSPTPAAPAPAAADGGMIEFDLGALSLDLPGAPAAPATRSGEDSKMSTTGLEMDVGGDGGEDPLATKLALAQEFNAIGDADGARSLAEEVIAEASGDLKNRAQKFLAEIG